MCGIAALLQSPQTPSAPDWQFWAGTTTSQPPQNSRTPPLTPSDITPQLTRRGPDATLHQTIRIPTSATPCTLHLTQTILSHRGAPPTTLQTPEGNVLLYNGELYDTPSADTAHLSHLLDALCAASPFAAFPPAALRRLDALRGPWTLIFWHARARRLYFARDQLGRRSLLLRVLPSRAVELVSVAPRAARHGFFEVPPLGLAFIHVPLDGRLSFGAVQRESRSVAPRRVVKADGRLVAGSAKEMYVSFLPANWLRAFGSGRELLDIGLDQSVDGFIARFRHSVRRRLVTNRMVIPGQSRYAVLFSGGIDSMVIARVLDECLTPGEGITLINVAFGADSQAVAQCPDRLSAISGCEELRALSETDRVFDLCCVDVAPEQADETLEKQVRLLVHPCDQAMDASIGTAIWLAARADGRSHSGLQGTAKEARILFSGLGADELMGGYKGRHRTIYRTEGVYGVLREMDADLSRLWFRNLGRDDRLVADHGKEVRHPFLDEDLIEFVTGLPLERHVCDLSRPDGIGDKHLLRRAAIVLGLSAETASRSKRAIQFGSRSKQVIERKGSC